nr:TPA: acetyltransferase, GNAT family protein [Neospora caninum Liverpool]
MLSTLRNLMNKQKRAMGMQEASLLGQLANSDSGNQQPREDTSSRDIWFRKRVGPCIAEPERLPLSQRCVEVAATLDLLTKGSQATRASECLGDFQASGTTGNTLLPQAAETSSSSVSEPAAEQDNIAAGFTRTGWTYRLLNVPWCRQIGPSCGVSALCMASTFFAMTGQDADRPVPSTGAARGTALTSAVALGDHLLKLSREWGISMDGEVFSVYDFVRLARIGAHLDATAVEFAPCEDSDGDTADGEPHAEADGETLLLHTNAWNQITSFIRRGWLLIVPYDSEGGYPALKGGRKAHYGVVLGVACREAQQRLKLRHSPSLALARHEAGDTVSDRRGAASSTSCRGEKKADGDAGARETTQRGPPNEDGPEQYLRHREEECSQACDESQLEAVHASLLGRAVVLQHGRSRLLTVATWDHLMNSNAQLRNANKIAFPHACEMKLRNRAILVRGFLSS